MANATKVECILCRRGFQPDGGMICDLCRLVIDTPVPTPSKH